MSSVTSSATPTSTPVYLFLSPVAPSYISATSNPTPNLVYRATEPGDLRLFLEAVRADTTLVKRVTKIYLTEEYDNMYDSEVLDFVEEYNVAIDTAKQEDGQKYGPESPAQGVQVETKSEEDESLSQPISALPTPTASQILTDVYPPIPPTPRLPTSSLGDDDDTPSCPLDPSSLSSSSLGPAIVSLPAAPGAASSPAFALSDPFRTAVENFALAKTLAGITDNDAITHEMYMQFVSELLAVFEGVEGVFGPMGWEVY